MRKRFLIMMLIGLVMITGCQTSSRDMQSQEMMDNHGDVTNGKDDFAKVEEHEKEQDEGKELLQENMSKQDVELVPDKEKELEVVITQIPDKDITVTPSSIPTLIPSPTITPTLVPTEIPKKSYTYKEMDKTMYAVESVNVRTQPNTNGEKAGVLKRGDAITVSGRCNETGWYRIKIDNESLYVSDKYLTMEKPVVSTPTPMPTANPSPTPVPTVTATSIPTVTPKPTKEPVKTPEYTVKDIDDTAMYAKSNVNVRKGPSAKYDKMGSLSTAQKVTVTGQASTGWYQIKYDNSIGYVSDNYLVKDKPVETDNNSVDMSFPIHYSDATSDITITKEWYQDAFVYAVHIKFSDYKRLATACANGKYNSGNEVTSKAAKRIGALLAVNGDCAVPGNGAGNYAIARDGIVCNDKALWSEGIYNGNTGLLTYRTHDGCEGKTLSELVKAKKVTDTFQFGPAFLLNGSVKASTGGGRAQTTFIGTNGNPGDIWICVADGRYNDGKSAGLTYYQCASYLKSKECTFGIPLDGGGSSTIVWNGKVLNAAKGNERAVADFLYFK